MSSEKIPLILENAWSVRTPREEQLVEQIAPAERKFLIEYAQYLTDVYCGKNLDNKRKDIVINDIISTANTRIHALSKEVNPSLTHAVMAVVLYLLSNILSNEHVKYKTQGEMMAVYPSFLDRPEAEKQNLFLTANWMSILFRVLPAKKNKGIAMDIIPKFVEGNSAHYVTGGGQTQATRDRVFIYETEGDCKPIKRLKRKSKSKLEEEEREAERMNMLKKEDSGGGGGNSDEHLRKKMNRNNVPQSPSQTQAQSVASISSLYFPLPAPFFHAQPLPIPVISPRSQSSFSQAAAVIANFGQVQPELSSYSSGSSSGSGADSGVSNSSGHTSGEHPRECYLDIEEDGTVVKKFSPRSSARPSVATSSTSIPFTSTPLFLARGKSGDRSGGGEATGVTNTTSTSSLYDSSAPPSSLSFLSSAAASVSSSSSTGGGGSGPLSFPPPDLTSSASNVSRMSSTTSTFDKFVEAIGTVDDHDSHDSHDKLPQDQLAMLREASADSDI